MTAPYTLFLNCVAQLCFLLTSEPLNILVTELSSSCRNRPQQKKKFIDLLNIQECKTKCVTATHYIELNTLSVPIGNLHQS